MRFVKLGIISIVFFGFILTAISLLLPSSINISRAININAPADTVFAYINNLANWQKWYADYAPSQTRLSNRSIGKGAAITVNGTTVTISETSPLQIKAVWQTNSNKPLPGEFNLIAQKASSQMTVQWLFIHKVKWYPWQKLALMVSDKSIGPFMERSLDNLKKAVEKQ